jgi:hypothetical protein
MVLLRIAQQFQQALGIGRFVRENLRYPFDPGPWSWIDTRLVVCHLLIFFPRSV